MKLPHTAHTSRPWRIHEIAPDFDLLDVWALPTPGGADDFPRLVGMLDALDPATFRSFTVRALVGIRYKLGEIFGWDDERKGLGGRVRSLRDRLPDDLRGAPTDGFDHLPAAPVYVTEDEAAAEVANQTVHGILHLGWVEDGDGGYRGQLAILVKPNGMFGKAYMTGIEPFRHFLVYPTLMREIEERWQGVTSEARTT